MEKNKPASGKPDRKAETKGDLPEAMPTYAELLEYERLTKLAAQKAKEKKVKKEILRLNRVFKSLDGNKFATVQSLIRIAAFMAVSLDELQDIINREGYTQEYKNGANQFGIKQSAEVELHIAMTRNHTTVIKQLADLCPAEARKDSRLEALRRE